MEGCCLAAPLRSKLKVRIMNSTLRLLKNILTAIAIQAIIFIILLIAVPTRVNASTIIQLLQQAIAPAILAWGVCFDFKVGLWDFSVGAVVLVAGILGGNLALIFQLGIIGVIFMCSLVGVLVGLLTGILFTVLKIPSIIVSIGMMLILESFCGLIFGGQGVMIDSSILVISQFPVNIIACLLAFAIAFFIYNYTKFGFHVRAVGNGISIAKMNGINIARVRALCFAIAGLFAGFYAFMQIGGASIMRAQSNMSTMGTVFDAIICVFIALALEKSVNLIIGVYIGALTAQIIKLGILVIGFPSMYQQVVIALFLLLFMTLSSRGDLIKKKLNKVFKLAKVAP